MKFGFRQISTASGSLPFAIALAVVTTAVAISDEVDSKDLEQSYRPDIQRLVQRYCHECHGKELAEAEVNLASFSTWADVRKQPQVWQKVGEMLDSRQMPPKDAEQPTDAERAQLQKWVRAYLTFEAKARAGDPGRVVLRRLSNAEYTYTIRDLTGVASLDPALEFPVDGAAGEGFTNTGNALVMSPSLVTKYLDAAKDTANHAVLLPDGFRFSRHSTARDWTDDTLTEIRDFYRQFTDSKGGDKVNLQGIVFDTNEGGRLPLEKYLAATLIERQTLTDRSKTIEAAARDHGLNAKYLGTLWQSLTSSKPSLLLDGVRARWRTAKPEDAAALAEHIGAWQKGLWRFTTVGHIGKVGGPKRWQEPVNPLISQHDIRFTIPPASDGREVILSLVATDVGDGNEHDYVVWQQPRLVAPGRPDLLLRDVRGVTQELTARRTSMFDNSAKFLAAADEADAAQGKADVAALAQKHGIGVDELSAWLDYLGIGSGGMVELTGHFTNKLTSAAGYDFIQGWGSHETPLLLANSSDQHVRVPGNMRPHSVAVHPTPKLKTVVGWRSPMTATMTASASVTHAHPECGNGVTWSIELRRGATRQRLATGVAQGGTPAKIDPIMNLSIQTGDVVTLAIGPRDGNHSCDLTAIDLTLSAQGDDAKLWNLAKDVSSDVLTSNPHADRFGNNNVWHFYTEEDKGDGVGPIIPPGSLLAKWQLANSAERRGLADEIQKLLTTGASAKDNPDAALYQQLASLGGPLLGGALRGKLRGDIPRRADTPASSNGNSTDQGIGVDPALFGKHPNGALLDPASLCVRAPSATEIRLPADLVAGCELVTTGLLDKDSGAEGSVQLSVVAGSASTTAGLVPSQVNVTVKSGQWTSDNRTITYGTPILVNEGSGARKRIEAGLEEFRNLFPAALCYTKIVPVDEVVTLTLFYREDDHLVRLMLDERQRKRLDQLWDELHFVSHDAITLVDAFAQLMEYATQDADPKVFEPLRKPIEDRAAAFRQQLVDAEPKQLDSLLRFARLAYRRPLSGAEVQDLRELYAGLRKQELPHDEAFRLTLARVLVAPAFLYRVEMPTAGAGQAPVSDWELASRLSYFVWSSQPDEQLLELASAGKLHETTTLLEQTQRMLHDEKVRRLATEFACQWLQIRDFNQLDEKSEKHFPEFVKLRDAMYEESIHFFIDLFQNNGSVLDILDSDYTFLNEDLAKHYGISEVHGAEWRRVDGIRKYHRGGILAQSTVLAKQSGASRTSPILRGNWISEVLLGERLPRPPKGVPPLPDDESATEGLTVRQLVEKHSSDPKCAVCHVRIDPFGFSLERFDSIGRHRDKDLGDRRIDTRATTVDGVQLDGLEGLRNYLLSTRRDAFVRQFCRKLLGFALGRAVQLSDELLLGEMQNGLKENDYKIQFAIEVIVKSRQFREIRGMDSAYED